MVRDEPVPGFNPLLIATMLPFIAGQLWLVMLTNARSLGRRIGWRQWLRFRTEREVVFGALSERATAATVLVAAGGCFIMRWRGPTRMIEICALLLSPTRPCSRSRVEICRWSTPEPAPGPHSYRGPGRW